MSKLEDKLKLLPKTPGVYFHKDKDGEIIYVGKAANLRIRVRQYFQKSRVRDNKTDALVSEISDVEWSEVETELDALFMEAEMIRRYMPKYNILLRDDKSFIYVRINFNSNHPTVKYTRRPLDDGAEYFGPYLSKFTISKALRALRRVFPYSTHTPTNIPKRACLQAQIGLCPGLEADMTSLDDYRKNLRQLAMYVTGKRKKLLKIFEQDMKKCAEAKDYEAAASARNKLFSLKNLDSQIIFGDRESVDLSRDRGLSELGKLIGIDPPKRIEGFDISHMQGRDTTASMVVFVAGMPDKGEYRKFKMRVPGNDDFAHMHEVLSRRFSPRNTAKWGKPDLILIDGGKGQVSSALKALAELEQNIPLVGLAKRYEEIIIPNLNQNDSGQIAKNSQFSILRLPVSDDGLKLLQRIRDESHRFAISYHSSLKRTRQTSSMLDEIPGIGPETKKRLIKKFGSLRNVRDATEAQVASVIGKSRAKLILNYMDRAK